MNPKSSPIGLTIDRFAASRQLFWISGRDRIAEIGKHAVAHVLSDEPAVTLDQFRAAAVICADDLSLLNNLSDLESVHP
jgi:hypothetical protein